MASKIPDFPPAYLEGIRAHEAGYLEVADKPDAAALHEYYSQKYFQQSQGQYQKTYSEAEQLYLHNRLAQKRALIEPLLPANSRRLLDVGAGEGWALAAFHAAGWQVTGIDYSDYACKYHHPDCLSFMRAGDVGDLLAAAAVQGETFDCVILDNVLEHSPQPLDLLQATRKLLVKGGVLVIEVPNDFSTTQAAAVAAGHIDRPFWVVTPDHLSYFNLPGLQALAGQAGFEALDALSDFPIDFFLFNANSNYIRDKTAGKNCHQARVQLENLMHATSMTGLLNIYRELANMGLGRQIMAIFRAP